MKSAYEKVEDYLNEVDHYLQPLADKDQILKELRAHIWDTAHKMSETEKGLTIEDAFEQALLVMESPEKLANKFLEEESNIVDTWKAPLKTPESKIQNDQFVILAAVGFIGVLFISWLIQLTTDQPLVTWLSFFLGLIGIAFFIMAIYITDEKTFKEQMFKMRKTFQRSYDDIRTEFQKRTTPVPKKSIEIYYEEDKQERTEVGFWPAFGEHLGGFIGGVFLAIGLAFLLYLEISGIPIFNEHWYRISGPAIYISLVVDIAYSALIVIVGKIRFTRLASAGKEIISGAACVTVLVYYPFTLVEALQSVIPSEIYLDPEVSNILSNADVFLQIIFGIVAIISFLSALYAVFKFGAWKSSERKSLL
jgi:hypothetical protein